MVNNRTEISRPIRVRLLKFFQGCQNSPAPAMPEHYHQPRTEMNRRKLDAFDLRGANNVAGDTDDEQVAWALVEDYLHRHARVRASEDNSKRRLTCQQLGAACSLDERGAAQIARYEAMISLLEAFDCFLC